MKIIGMIFVSLWENIAFCVKITRKIIIFADNSFSR